MEKRREKGYALIVVLLFVALVLISLSIAAPTVLWQGKREKEEELLFRGQQYQTAIGRYYRKFGRYPMKMKDLLRTNDLAFLRQEYPDPMTKDGRWRVIHVGPSGELIGSTHVRRPQGAAGAAGATTAGEAADTEEETPARQAQSRFASAASSSGQEDSSPYPIAGVVSRSKDQSIRLYDGYSRYSDWEFIYDPVKEAMQNRPGGGIVPPATPPSGTSTQGTKPSGSSSDQR